MNSLILALCATIAVANAAPSWGHGALGAALVGPAIHGAALVGPVAPGAAVIGPQAGPSAVIGPQAGPSAIVGPVNHGAVITPALAAPSVLAAPGLGVVGGWGHAGIAGIAGGWGTGGLAGHGVWGGHW